MYFSSINNEEVKQFHKVMSSNFNMSLSNVLSSDLFHIETIIPNMIYRVFLLFYCEKITSTNSNDVILENKCIICNKTNEETYFNFISDENDVFILNQLNDYYSFGDKLSDDDFNGIVQLLRENNSFSENIQINNSTVKGTYGTYVFNLKSTTIVDNGVLITNETLSSIGTVKLMNPSFENSNYKLKLTVYALSDVNICNEVNKDNIIKTDLIIDLIKDSEVNIPFNTLDLNCIVGFNAIINITHDLPVIQYPRNIVLTSDKLNYYVGDPITLTAIYSGFNFNATDEILTFKIGDNVIGTAIANSDGIANYTYVPLNNESLNFNVVNKENNISSNNSEVMVAKKSTNISLNVNKNIVGIGEELIITGFLKNNNELLSDLPVKIMNGNQELFSFNTNNDGTYYIEINTDETFNYDLNAIFLGDSVYNSCESSYINVKCILKNNVEFKDISIKADTISGYLIDSNSKKGIANEYFEVNYDNNVVTGIYTDKNGYFNKTIMNAGSNYSPRTWNSLNYDGNDSNYPNKLNLSNINVLRCSKIINLGSTYVNYLTYYNGRLVDDLNNPIPNANISATSEYSLTGNMQTVVKNIVTDENGEFSVNSARDDAYSCVYKGTSNIEGCTGRIY